MNASEIIDEIKQLPPTEQARVLGYVRAMDKGREWSGAELTATAELMVAAADPVEAERLKQQLIAGFYGESVRA